MSTIVKVGAAAALAYFAEPMLTPKVLAMLPAKALDSPLAKTAVNVGLHVGIAMGAFALLSLVIK